MPQTPHLFGGDWTDEKLERVRKYLVAYATIMRKKRYRFAYVDAFAGTGYRSKPADRKIASSLFPALLEEESQQFLDGSARIALQVKPRFDRYIFIEQAPARYAELEKLRDEFHELRDDIILIQSDANSYIIELCAKDWSDSRAILFLDPYGMQVGWETIKAIAATKAIDLWILFPLGVAVNRMLTKDGEINEAWRRKLDMIFGATDWYDTFYRTNVKSNLFGQEAKTEKIVDFNTIGRYYVGRLRTIFAGVADNPLPLLNSRNNPLYLLCFATGNPNAVKPALKIAEDILGR